MQCGIDLSFQLAALGDKPNATNCIYEPLAGGTTIISLAEKQTCTHTKNKQYIYNTSLEAGDNATHFFGCASKGFISKSSSFTLWTAALPIHAPTGVPLRSRRGNMFLLNGVNFGISLGVT
jgi:hypothetical protein